MKHKKWVITLLVSLALIAASLVVTFVVLIPKIGRTKLLDTVLSGDREKTREEFRELGNEEKEDLKEDIEDIVVYTHNRYMDGKISYEEMFSVYYSVETIKNYRNMTERSFEIVHPPKLIESYEKAVGLYDAKNGNYSGDDFYKEKDNFQNLMRCRDAEGNSIRTYWDSEVEDTYKRKMQDELDAYLKGKYESYLAGSIDYEKADAYVKTAASFWSSEYTGELRDKLYYDKYFQEQLDDVEKLAEEKEYFSALRQIESIRQYYSDNEVYPGWESRFDEKYKEYEEAAKTYYVEIAIEYLKSGDNYMAEYTVQQLKQHFGEDFDTSAIDAARPADWLDPYLRIMKDWKSNLKTDYQNFRNMSGVYEEFDFEELCPNQILLQDLDADGIPEMILQNDKKDVFIYSYHDGKTWFLGGVIDYKGIREPGEFIFVATVKDEDRLSVTYRILECVKDHQLVIDTYIGHVISDGEHMYYQGSNISSINDVDDFSEIDEATYNTKKDEFDAMQKAENMPAGVAIDGYEEYIRNWK